MLLVACATIYKFAPHRFRAHAADVATYVRDWVHGHQLIGIEFLKAENPMLKERLQVWTPRGPMTHYVLFVITKVTML